MKPVITLEAKPVLVLEKKKGWEASSARGTLAQLEAAVREAGFIPTRSYVNRFSSNVVLFRAPYPTN